MLVFLLLANMEVLIVVPPLHIAQAANKKIVIPKVQIIKTTRHMLICYARHVLGTPGTIVKTPQGTLLTYCQFCWLLSFNFHYSLKTYINGMYPSVTSQPNHPQFIWPPTVTTKTNKRSKKEIRWKLPLK